VLNVLCQYVLIWSVSGSYYVPWDEGDVECGWSMEKEARGTPTDCKALMT
jgi:hypothetical protein